MVVEQAIATEERSREERVETRSLSNGASHLVVRTKTSQNKEPH